MSTELTNDEKLAAITNGESADVEESNANFDTMIDEANKWIKDTIGDEDTLGAIDKADDELILNANEQLTQTKKELNQQKEQARENYLKEQTAAFVDYQKGIDPYGANAERIAAAGLTGSGYSESANVRTYNTYQNRVATARASYERAVTDYDNAIAQAENQNSSLLAEIAYSTLQQKLEYSLQGFQYKNSLIIQKAEAERAIRNDYFARWKAVMDQINTEKDRTEEQVLINKENNTTRLEDNEAYKKIKAIHDRLNGNNQQSKAPIVDIKGGVSDLGYGYNPTGVSWL